MGHDRRTPTFAISPASRMVTTLSASIDRAYEPTLDVLVRSSVWLSAALASLTLFTAHVLRLPVDLRPLTLVLASSLWIYNMDHLRDAGEGTESAYFTRPSLRILMVASFAATALLLVGAPTRVLPVFFGYSLVGLLYSIPVIPTLNSRGVHWARVKDAPGAKSWIVAAAIATATVGLPVAFSGSPFSFQAFCVWSFFFVFVGTGAHMCDVRDIAADREEGVLTLPVLLGVSGAKRLLGLLNLGFLLLLTLAWAFDGFGTHPEILAVCAVACLYVYWIRPSSPREAWSVALDGAFFLPASLALIHESFHGT